MADPYWKAYRSKIKDAKQSPAPDQPSTRGRNKSRKQPSLKALHQRLAVIEKRLKRYRQGGGRFIVGWYERSAAEIREQIKKLEKAA